MRLPRALLVAAALAAAAATPPARLHAAPAKKPAKKAAPRKSSAPTPDLYAGYSYTHAGEASLNGWGLAGAYPLNPRLRLVLDLTGHYGSFGGASLSQLGLFAGARGVWAWHGLSPFAEGLVGFARTNVGVSGLSEADTDWGLALGGGLDYPLSPRWAARGLFQLRLLHGQGVWDSDPRFSVGAVYRFGQ